MSGFWDSVGDLIGGAFGHSGSPYDKAMEQYRDWTEKGRQVQQPYVDAGTGAIGDYQAWLNKQKDPTKFINDTMSQYKESPYAQYLQKQAMYAGQNAGSASGMTGSTPLIQQMQTNAGNIASGDMNEWLSKVLGINTQYGQGQSDLMHTGQNSANSLTNLYDQTGQRMGDASYGSEAGKNQDWRSIISGGLGLASMFL